MTGDSARSQAGLLGDLPPLNAAVSRMPDRRQVSLRWLSGTFLVGVTSVTLMGGALYAALEGRQQLALPAQAYEREAGLQRPGAEIAKGDRPGINLNIESSNSKLMMVSTVTREGDRDVVKVRPFLRVGTPLAVAPKRDLDYPRFDALAVFSDSGAPEPVLASNSSSDLIYGADVDSEMSIKLVEFDTSADLVSRKPRQRATDIEEMVRNAAPRLDTGSHSFAALSYFDPVRFAQEGNGLLTPSGVTITAENVTVQSKAGSPANYAGIRYEERVVRVRADAAVSLILKTEGMDEAEADLLEKVLSSDIGSSKLQPEDRLRIVFEIDQRRSPPTPRAIRVSVYRNATHMVSIARTDDNRFVYATEPDPIPQIAAAQGASEPVLGSHLPTVYDAIYRASMSEGLSSGLARQLVRIFSADVDFNATVSPTDELAVFVSLEDNEKEPTDRSEILYASIKLGQVTRKYYRFRDPETGRNDFFDETGKSAKKFLLRQPVPTGKFRSPFGARWHPILKYRKMHWGVDWAAPRGTPIMVAGDGVVISAGWESGYGRHTEIRHANGYVTSYSHQNSIAPGVVPGARVRQGQVIGYVGSTGLSTGPHLHYEVIVNGTKVDPMRIRLPKGKVLEGGELATFTSERDRIDDLLVDKDETEVAQF